MQVYDKIKLARRPDRPTAKDYIDGMIEGFLEMHGDRRFADDAAVIAGVGTLSGMPITVIGIEKGHDVNERLARAFGCASPEGYRKALRQMKLAEKFNRPVLCIVDTQGANCGVGAEERGEGQAIAENLYEMMTLGVPVITLMIGEGGSGGALALAVADEVWMCENAYYSVVSPEACASILYKDSSKADVAAEHLHLVAEDLLSYGIIERILEEPESFEDVEARGAFYASLKQMLAEKLQALCKMTRDAMLDARYEKYRKIGRYAESGAPNGGMPIRRRRFFGKKTKR